ncbi:hypothetical protein SAMN02745866_03124 [Alteromonadaceae bacterium Bs31]|nr:hypothetical protein SAMN02745866_03124 [Alteromonadaceae bacterium Bs31]
MKCLSIRINPKSDLGNQLERFVELSKSLGRYPEIDYEDNGIVYLNYFSERLPELWRDLREGIFEHTEIGTWVRAVCEVVCEGEAGWHEALLLYHYDKNEQLDSLD